MHSGPPSEGTVAAEWLRAAIVPVLVLVVIVAIVAGVVAGGAVQGHKVYAVPASAPTTQPTMIIQP